MSTEVRHVPDESRFEVNVDGTRAGAALYEMSDGRWVFTHTEVDDAYEGEGLGSQLASQSLDFVRRAGALVVPLCPFVAGWIDRHDDYADLVDTEMLAELQ